jgi:hypothetical protein
MDELMEIISDPSMIPSIAREHDPELAVAVRRYYHSNTLWRWLNEGKLKAASLILNRLR